MKKTVIMATIMMFCLSILVGCDPIYPPGELRVTKIAPLSQGDNINIEIIYPNNGGSIVLGWEYQNIEIISGDDIVAVSGLSLTGIKPGTAIIKVNATTIISEEAAESGYEEKVYSTREIEINVR